MLKLKWLISRGISYQFWLYSSPDLLNDRFTSYYNKPQFFGEDMFHTLTPWFYGPNTAMFSAETWEALIGPKNRSAFNNVSKHVTFQDSGTSWWNWPFGSRANSRNIIGVQTGDWIPMVILLWLWLSTIFLCCWYVRTRQFLVVWHCPVGFKTKEVPNIPV